MESLQINILDPKARKLLEDLAELKLIEIKSQEPSILEVYQRIRARFEDSPISEEEIIQEVAEARAIRYGGSKP